MDAALLAETLTIFLSPALPYLAKAGEKALEEAGKKLGSGAMEKASEVWRKLRPAVDAKPAAKEAADDVAEAPDDEELRTALRVQLRKILQQDSELAAALETLLAGVETRGGDHFEIHGPGTVAKVNEVHGPFVQGDYVIHPPGPSTPEPDDAERLRDAYLRWVMESAGYLTLGGIDPAVAGHDADTRLRLDASASPWTPPAGR